ncbi:hypothetical protein JOB18_014828 [Solea senegalensis]|uniref:Uncharacterized protein n=1 Tax=Solea senegalensis TaxID=28829 RepID=A0AAV6PXK3_SOLSE|nr:hypothetical protein JOB18_014828 [Solea senegalensis]
MPHTLRTPIVKKISSANCHTDQTEQTNRWQAAICKTEQGGNVELKRRLDEDRETEDRQKKRRGGVEKSSTFEVSMAVVDHSHLLQAVLEPYGAYAHGGVCKDPGHGVRAEDRRLLSLAQDTSGRSSSIVTSDFMVEKLCSQPSGMEHIICKQNTAYGSQIC